MTISISSVLVDCLQQFNALVSRKDLASHDVEVATELWADELGRLRVWGANIGAHQTGQSSLDYRLRDASHIKDQTIKLLQRLQRIFEDLDESLTELDGEDEDDLLGDEEGTDIQQIYRGLVDTINCLFQLSMTIRRPTQHDRLLGTKRIDVTAFELYDRQHVAHKYPYANSVVIDRLGAAISRRRASLKYRERHNAKLAKGIDHDPGDGCSTRLSETVATDFVMPRTDFEETASNSGVSQTSYTPSLWESTKGITVPSPPKESADGRPFECPYCFFVITTPSRLSWTRHVFKDLMPYVCVFSDCSTPNRLYDSRRAWLQHLLSNHNWGSTLETRIDCPLVCGKAFPSTQLEQHLGRHLQDLALFALPRRGADEEEASGKSRSSSIQARPLDVGVSYSSSEEIRDLLNSPTTAYTSQDQGISREAEEKGVSAEGLPSLEPSYDVRDHSIALGNEYSGTGFASANTLREIESGGELASDQTQFAEKPPGTADTSSYSRGRQEYISRPPTSYKGPEIIETRDRSSFQRTSVTYSTPVVTTRPASSRAQDGRRHTRVTTTLEQKQAEAEAYQKRRNGRGWSALTTEALRDFDNRTVSSRPDRRKSASLEGQKPSDSESDLTDYGRSQTVRAKPTTIMLSSGVKVTIPADFKGSSDRPLSFNVGDITVSMNAQEESIERAPSVVTPTPPSLPRAPPLSPPSGSYPEQYDAERRASSK